MAGRVIIKSGAEGVIVAVVPKQKPGIALKIEDGNSRAPEVTIVAMLRRLDLLDPVHPMAQKRLPAPQRNGRGIAAAELRLAAGFV